jgi:hypothetical protein
MCLNLVTRPRCDFHDPSCKNFPSPPLPLAFLFLVATRPPVVSSIKLPWNSHYHSHSSKLTLRPLPSPPSPKEVISSAPPTTPFLGGAWGRLCRPQRERAGPPRLVGSGLETWGLGRLETPGENATTLVSQPPLGAHVLDPSNGQDFGDGRVC